MSSFDAPKGARRPKSAPKAAKARGPKSHKADGTPKKRWSSAERKERGHEPRRSGGQREDSYQGKRPREERAPRWDSDRRDARDRRDSFRDDRRPFNRDERRPVTRDDRGGFKRDDRGGFGRDERRPFNRDDRGDRGGFTRDERRPFNRDDRGDRSGFNRDERRPFTRDDRGDRGGFTRDERRPFNRDDRGGFRRDDRGDRGFTRDDRGFGGDERRSFGGRSAGAGHHHRAGERPSNRSWVKREERHFADRIEHSEDRFARRGREERTDFDSGEATEADTMEWEATELDVDTSTVSGEDGFAQLGLPEQLVAALSSQGISDPFPIQAATIPVALTGRDVLGRGRTGSGKTLSFGLPMLTRIANSNGFKNAPAGMVLVPTRELALQVADVLSPLASTLGLKLVLIAGGMSYAPQIKAFEKGVDIVVATPGRLIDLLEQGVADLSKVQVTVLDEADHMADLGFMPAVTTLLDAVPGDGQRMLFSATLDGAVDRLVRRYLTDPSLHEVDENKASVSTMEHRLLLVSPHHKNATTAAVANRAGRTVIFARTQLGASRIAEQLREQGVMAGALHGGLTQGARARMLAAFKTGVVPVLVATDVAARGIHVDDVSLVLQVDPPMNAKDYLHRAGRTARAGEKGVVATIVLPHQRRQVQRLIGSAGVKTEPISLTPEDEKLTELTGARIADGEPINSSTFEALIAPKKQVRSRPRGEGGFRRGGDRGGFRKGGDRGGFRKGGDGGGFRKSAPRRDRIAEPGGWN